MVLKLEREVEITHEDLKDQLSPLELLDIFTAAANKIADGGITYEKRRAFAHAFSHAMSENAKRFLAEIFSADYIAKTCDNVPEFP